MAEDTRKNILEVDVVQSIDKTDTVLVNDSGSLKQVSVEALVSSGIPDQYVTESELKGDIREEVEDYMSKNPVTVKTTDVVEKDNTLPVTSAGVYTVCGNIEALLQAL